MAAIITEKFRLHNAEQFLESLSESSADTYYIGIGKPKSIYYYFGRPDHLLKNSARQRSVVV